MSSGVRMRDAGVRKAQHVKSRPSLLSGSLGGVGSELGEKRLNLQQVYALEHMYQSTPAVQAARTVLSGQLLSGGISLRKDGVDVELTPMFRQHLNEVWVPFAQHVVDAFLKWGLVVVSYEEDESDERRARIHARHARRDDQARRTRKLHKGDGGGSVAAAVAARAADAEAHAAAAAAPPLVVPHVPLLGTYEVAFVMGGRAGYKRAYRVYSQVPGEGTEEDPEARVVVRQHPDQVGNINSPLASVFEMGSFIGALTELALTAEASRARPRMVTQTRKKDAGALEPSNLFFDSESRAAQAGADSEENTAAARSLAMQQQLCNVINRLQTQHAAGAAPDHDLHSFGGQGRIQSGRVPLAPDPAPPALFSVPKDQELCPSLPTAEARGDLEALVRVAVEQFAAAFGVPADLIFSGRFAGKSTSQLSLLNVTVSQLAKSVNEVLTMAYRDIYAAPGEDVGQLQLLTSPLAATEEVLKLFEGGLIPVNLAMPAVLHAIGTTKEDIDTAVERAMVVAEEKDACERCERKYVADDHALNLREREAGVRKTEAETKKAEHDAAAPHTTGGSAASAASGGSGGSGGSSK